MPAKPRAHRPRRTAIGRGLAAALFAAALPAALAAGPARAAETAPFAGTAALGETALAALRGGFVAPDGLLVRFGIDTAAYVNGRQVAGAILTQGELSAAGVSVRQGPQTALADPLPAAGTSVQTVLNGGLLLTQIHNTLDNQVIRQINRVTLDIVNLPALGRLAARDGLPTLPGLR